MGNIRCFLFLIFVTIIIIKQCVATIDWAQEIDQVLGGKNKTELLMSRMIEGVDNFIMDFGGEVDEKLEQSDQFGDSRALGMNIVLVNARHPLDMKEESISLPQCVVNGYNIPTRTCRTCSVRPDIFGIIKQNPVSVSEETRKKKFGKKKKKMLEKIYYITMMLKAKFSLILQFISTHIRFKLFIIGLINLIFTAARFWLDLKKPHQPSKVIYYEHAHHQHHYDHEDDHSYWDRSNDDLSSHNLAYSAHSPN